MNPPAIPRTDAMPKDALRENENLFRVLAEMSPVATAVSSPDGALLYANSTFRELFGYTPEELEVWQTHQAYCSPEDLDGVVGMLRDTGAVRDREVRLKRRDGTPFWALVAASRTSFCGAEAFVTTIMDITERKGAEEALRKSEERFKLSMEATSDGLWDWTIKTDEAYFSPAYYEMLGYEPGDFAGRGSSWKDLLHADDRRQALEANMACINGMTDSFEVEFRMKAADGEWRWILSRGKAVTRDCRGRALRLVGTHADITERKRAEEELQKLNRELESRVRERTAELAHTIASLQTEYAERMRTMEELHEKDRLLSQQSRLAAMGEMINNIAHQWRQPLNVVGMHLQRLVFAYDLGRLDRQFLKESSDAAMDLVLHMSRTIDDFRNFFKPNKEKTTFTLSDAIGTTVALVRDGFLNNRIEIETALQEAGSISGYYNEFCQALLNILQNARDALTERDICSRKVSIASAVEEGRTVIAIADNGGGIPEEILPHIFDPYFSTKGVQGTGIGLYMAKNIIEASMGGRISACNNGDGAVFRIEL